MQYLVDSTPVNSRTDWRHVPLGLAPQTRRVEMYPGIAERFIIRDTPMPNGVVVIGFLDGVATTVEEAVTQIKDAIEQWSTVAAIGSTHTITAHDDDYEECYLDSFEAPGPLIAFSDGSSGKGLKVACRFVWVKAK